MTAHSSPAVPTPSPSPYDFDTPVDRRGTWCTQWDYVQDRFGVPDLLPFTISDMDFETAPEVPAALRGRLDHGVLGYSRWRQDDFRPRSSTGTHRGTARTPDPASVVYAPSVVYQISRLLRLWSRPGDGGGHHTPMYDAFPKTVAASGRRLLEVPLDDWAELERLLALPDTAVLLLCSPHNPTGRVWSAGELDRMARLCARHGVAVVSDEIHSDLAHAPHVHRPWVRHGGDGRWAVATSASKSFNIPALTGSYGIIGDPVSARRLPAAAPRTRTGSPPRGAVAGRPHRRLPRGGALAGRAADVSRGQPLDGRRPPREAFPQLDWQPPQAGYLAWIDRCVRSASTTRSCNANWWRWRKVRSCPVRPTALRDGYGSTSAAPGRRRRRASGRWCGRCDGSAPERPRAAPFGAERGHDEHRFHVTLGGSSAPALRACRARRRLAVSDGGREGLGNGRVRGPSWGQDLVRGRGDRRAAGPAARRSEHQHDTWGAQRPDLAAAYRVLLPERRAHGHTPDVPGPLTYRDMAEDTVAFVETVVGGPAHLVGWSDGGVVALLVAVARPDLVRRAVVIGANFRPGTRVLRRARHARGDDARGAGPGVLPRAVRGRLAGRRGPLAGGGGEGARHVAHPADAHRGRAGPRPGAHPRSWPGTTDLMTLEHTTALYRAVPGAQLGGLCLEPLHTRAAGEAGPGQRADPGPPLRPGRGRDDACRSGGRTARGG